MSKRNVFDQYRYEIIDRGLDHITAVGQMKGMFPDQEMFPLLECDSLTQCDRYGKLCDKHGDIIFDNGDRELPMVLTTLSNWYQLGLIKIDVLINLREAYLFKGETGRVIVRLSMARKIKSPRLRKYAIFYKDGMR